MTKIAMDLNQLLLLPNAEIEKMRGRFVSVTLKNGIIIDGRITNFEEAANPPHLFTGFVFGDNHISFSSIDFIELLTE